MRCPRCGNDCPDNATECPRCSRKLWPQDQDNPTQSGSGVFAVGITTSTLGALGGAVIIVVCTMLEMGDTVFQTKGFSSMIAALWATAPSTITTLVLTAIGLLCVGIGVMLSCSRWSRGDRYSAFRVMLCFSTIACLLGIGSLFVWMSSRIVPWGIVSWSALGLCVLSLAISSSAMHRMEQS